MEKESTKGQGGRLMRKTKFHIYLDDEEYRQVVESLIALKNDLIEQGRYTDGVDDVLIKISKAHKKTDCRSLHINSKQLKPLASACRKRHSLGCVFLRVYGKIGVVIKMIEKRREKREQVEIFSIEEFVPANHLLRKIDSAVDFTHIYDLVEDLYCSDNGRPSIDPVVLFKMVLIQHLYGVASLRRTVEEIRMNVAYRWFLGYLMHECIPHFSTISYNFKHRYTKKQ